MPGHDTARCIFNGHGEGAQKDWNEVNFVTIDDDIREKGLGNDCCY